MMLVREFPEPPRNIITSRLFCEEIHDPAASWPAAPLRQRPDFRQSPAESIRLSKERECN